MRVAVASVDVEPLLHRVEADELAAQRVDDLVVSGGDGHEGAGAGDDCVRRLRIHPAVRLAR